MEASKEAKKSDSKEGPTIIYKLAKSRERTRDLTDIAFVKDRDGKIPTDGESIRTRWKGYFQLLFSVENDIEELQEVQPTEGSLPLCAVEGVRKQLENMGLNKACGPDDLPIEAVKILASYNVDHLTETMNIVMKDGMPRNWKRSRLVPNTTNIQRERQHPGV